MMNNQKDKINILLIDDRPENLLALEAIIERDDYHIVKAFSGEEGLKYLLKYEFAAILLDVQMPGIDGFGTARIIKAREKTKDIPILFITANNMDSEHIFTGYSIGAIDYILKPFDPIILKAKVEGFVEIYKMNQKLKSQAEILMEKARELEKAYKELSATTSQLRISEALANMISETSMNAMIVFDQDGSILKVNPAVKKMFHYDESEILSEHISVLFQNEDSKRYITKVLEVVSNLETVVGYENLKEVIATRKEGSAFPSEIQIGKRYVQGKCLIACTIHDISKRKENQEMITYMAYHDGLTELPNRRLFNSQLGRKLNQAKQMNQMLAMMYLDMDRFKYINDSLGHIVGDKLLQRISERLQECIREEDFLARIGGDEFNIILPNTNREDTLDIAERIIDAFQRPFFIDNYELFITACIGISIFPYDGEDSSVLMKNADAALYRAKQHGKNNYKVYHSGMNLQSYKTFILQNDLRKAIDNAEFSLVYQPRIDIKTEEVSSAEALIRWHHPTWGQIFPSEFIPIAEESGQIGYIGEWVLKEACRQNKAWQDAGLPPLRIAVNFSAQQFLQKDIVDKIKRVLVETGVSPSLLEIEITETSILGNEETITKTLNQLRKMGIFISIDDFGTGYSSLNYLRQFSIQTLKIDKSFIESLSNASSDSAQLVQSIISLAHNFGSNVIAEGVENEEQLNILRKYQCEEIQGYLFSPPIPPSDFEAFILNSQKDASSNQSSESVSMVEKLTVVSNDVASYRLDMASDDDYSMEILNRALSYTQKLYSISPREMDVFKLIVSGLNNKEIASKLFISEHTVKNHITHIFQKLTVNDRIQAMAKLYQMVIEEGKSL